MLWSVRTFKFGENELYVTIEMCSICLWYFHNRKLCIWDYKRGLNLFVLAIIFYYDRDCYNRVWLYRDKHALVCLIQSLTWQSLGKNFICQVTLISLHLAVLSLRYCYHSKLGHFWCKKYMEMCLGKSQSQVRLVFCGKIIINGIPTIICFTHAVYNFYFLPDTVAGITICT
jgi:hypothetical protein